MTVALQTPRNRYIGTGTTGPFAYGFRITAATDLAVTRLPAAAVTEIPLAYPADYSVSGVGNVSGGAITLTVALAVGDVLLIRRAMPIAQSTNISNGGPFYAATHETALDKGVMIDQQQQEQLDRSLRLPPTIDTASVNAQVPAPEAGKFIGWDATGTKLVNGTGAQGPQGPAGVGGPIPIFDTTAARDAFYPAPATNNLALNRETGFQQRFGVPSIGGPARWLNEGVTGSAGPLVRVSSKGGFGDGAHNERQAFVDTATAVAAGGIGEVDPGVWRIDTDVTLAGGWHFNRGVKIRPANGVTVTFSEISDDCAGHYQVLDRSLGGKFLFTSPYLAAVKLFWFGPVRDGATDDHLIIQAAINAAADGKNVIMPAGNYTIAVADQSVMNNREGVVLMSEADGRWPSAFFPRIKYTGVVETVLIADFTPATSTLVSCTPASGTPWGAADSKVGAYMKVVSGKGAGQSRWILASTSGSLTWGSTGVAASDYVLALDIPLDGTSVVRVVEPNCIIGMYWSRLCEVRGIYFQPNALADVCVNIDSPIRGAYSAAGGIGSSCKVTRCTMEAAPTKQHATGVAMTLSKAQNHEYHTFEKNIVAGGVWPGIVPSGPSAGANSYGRWYGVVGTTAASTTITRVSGPNFAATMVGQVVIIADAGVNSYRSFPHRAVVATFVDVNTMTITTAAVRTAGAGRAMIGQGNGYGFFIGQQANVKRMYGHENSLYGLQMAWVACGGSFHSDLESFTDNGCNIARFNGTEPSSASKLNTEHCNKLLHDVAQEPLSFTDCRLDNGEINPGSPWVDWEQGSESNISLKSCGFEQPVDVDASIFAGWGGGNALHMRDVKFTGSTTWAHLFGPNLTAPETVPLQMDYSGLDRGLVNTIPRYYRGGVAGTEGQHTLFVGDLAHILGRLHLKGGIRRVPLFVTVSTGGGPAAIDCVYVSVHRLRLIDGSAFTYPNPTNPTDGAELDLEVWNNSGGAMGAITMGSAFLGTFTSPANTKTTMAGWRYDGVRAKWLPRFPQTADV